MSKILDSTIIEHGDVVFVTSKIAPADFSNWVTKVAAESGERVAWRYHEDGVRMLVVYLGDRLKVEAAINSLLSEHNDMFRTAQAKEGVFYN